MRVPEVWSHRGLSGAPGWPKENTVEAFRAASELGVDGIECDVWRTGLGEWRVQHDRETPGGPIDIPSGGVEAGSLPSLGDAVAACAVVTVNVELKVPEDTPAPDAFAVGAELGAFLECEWPITGKTRRMVVSSFSEPAIDGVRSAATSRLETGLLVMGGVDLRDLAQIRRGGHTAIHVEHELITRALVQGSAASELRVVAWTVDEEERIRWLAENGVDAIISNVPELVARVCKCPEQG